MERKPLNRIWQMIVSCLLVMTILILNTLPACAIDARNPYNAIQVQVNGANEEGSIKSGQELWYKFTVPTGNSWLIVRVTTTNESGVLNCEVKGVQQNTIKGAYSLGGNQTCEMVFRIGAMNNGSTEEYIPRLTEGATYYLRLYGEGDFIFNVDSYVDDYEGEYANATALAAGATISGTLERNDDIDAFSFTVPTSNSYKVTVTASRKMNVKITDKDNYTIDNNSLRVMRDRGTSEYTISGKGEKRYFFLSGLTGTSYTISVAISADDSTLGNWTKVTATKGKSYIQIKTKKGAKLVITVKNASGKSTLKVKGKKILKTTQKKGTVKYRLNRKLKKGDVIKVTATKGRQFSFSYYKKIK